jgi:hypothetical protein
MTPLLGVAHLVSLNQPSNVSHLGKGRTIGRSDWFRKAVLAMHKNCWNLAICAMLLGACALPAAGEEKRDPAKAAPAKSEQEIQQWIARLGSNRYREREQATQELAQLGTSALAALKQAGNSADAEVRRRSRQLLERIEPAPVRYVVPFPSMLRIKTYL